MFIEYRGFWHSCSLRTAGIYVDCDGLLVLVVSWPFGYAGSVQDL